MLATGALPRVARLAGGTSPLLGFVVHLVISAIIGMSLLGYSSGVKLPIRGRCGMGTVVRTGLVVPWTSDLVPASPWGPINVDDSGCRFGTAIAYRPSHVWGGDSARVHSA
jgi:hypothetical protein